MSKTEKETEVRQAIIVSLKKEFTRASWWEEVQKDVKLCLFWIVDHVEEVGPLYSRSFMCLFRWEFERRKLTNQNVKNPMTSYFATLLGMRISEEAYQCGIMPVRAILDLYDYIRPNDADVAASLMLCHKIEILENSGLLTLNEISLKTSPSEMAKVLRKKHKSTQDFTLGEDQK